MVEPTKQSEDKTTSKNLMSQEKQQMEHKFHTKVEYCCMAKGSHGKCTCGEVCNCGPDCDCCKDYSSDR